MKSEKEFNLEVKVKYNGEDSLDSFDFINTVVTNIEQEISSFSLGYFTNYSVSAKEKKPFDTTKELLEVEFPDGLNIIEYKLEVNSGAGRRHYFDGSMTLSGDTTCVKHGSNYKCSFMGNPFVLAINAERGDTPGPSGLKNIHFILCKWEHKA